MAGLEGKTAIARALAAQDVRVAGGARRVEQLETEVKLELDVTDPASCERFVEQAVAELGGLDILVNNAGLGLGRDPFDASTEEDEETVLETNVHGVLRMTRLCLPHIRDGGHIVNMGSIAGRQAYENAATYVASKFAVRGFTYALREDLLGRPIRLTTVDPGLVESNFSRVRFRGEPVRAGGCTLTCAARAADSASAAAARLAERAATAVGPSSGLADPGATTADMLPGLLGVLQRLGFTYTTER